MGELLLTVARMSLTAALTALAVLALRWALIRLKAREDLSEVLVKEEKHRR